MQFIKYSVIDHIAEIALAHPPVNALSIPMLNEILTVLRTAKDDDNVRAIIIRSDVPKRFCAGLDLSILQDTKGLAVHEFLDKLYIELADLQHNLGKPSIAAVSGAARAGGMTLSISCNVIIAGKSSTFGYPEIDVGIIPAIHFIHLPAIVGRHRAFEILFSGRSFTSDEAYQLGLVSKVVDDDQVLEEARSLARNLAAKSKVVMRMGHNTFMRFNDNNYRRDIGHVVESFCTVTATDDAQEGIRAFVEKRKPNWS
ncbi:enoyl-CoA hydratase/isomerase family protein [Alcaligenaceae bacterium]|nr:enoyl-CoA hydratase/isomerase family protein [Alcaligenaceae bacterium]